MPWYRIGKPGEDALAHLNLGRRAGPAQCAMPTFAQDDHKIGNKCGRQSVALCDGPGCDAPICEFHRTKHRTKADTDYCPAHSHLADLAGF